jgi:hypothetical protein
LVEQRRIIGLYLLILVLTMALALSLGVLFAVLAN